ncbi:MAG TPA: pectin acetylesterase-family hydrolase [Phototrophicaceae bacterium]|nr:pectin acetylesterase-family hydrolase [Phototrophicaceae bacterium]
MKQIIFLLVLFSLFIGGGVLAQASTPAATALPNGWNEIPLPTGICARGTAYRFFVHPANPDKLLIYFQGGGACWNAATCKVGGTFEDSVNEAALASYLGIFNFDNPLNPIADYSVVFLPYCTGDIFTGSSTQSFTAGDGSSFQIHFAGFTDAQAVLDWTYAHYPNPTNLIVTGSSAGSYGAIFNAPYILSHYSQAQAAVFGDAGVGVGGAGAGASAAGAESAANIGVWGTLKNVYKNIGYLATVTQGDVASGLWAGAAQTFPNVSFGLYTTYADETQTSYYVLGGGTAADWTPGMEKILSGLDRYGNFHSYIAPGSVHTILPRPLFYTMRTDETPFRQWFTTLISGGALANVACTDCTTGS